MHRYIHHIISISSLPIREGWGEYFSPFLHGRVGVVLLFLLVLLASCSTSKNFEEGQLEIKKVIVVSDNPTINTDLLRNYVHQKTGLQNGKRLHLAYDSLKTALSCRDLAAELANEGYLHATTRSSLYIRPNTVNDRNPKCEVTYFLHPNEQYFFRNISYDIQDATIDTLITTSYKSLLQSGRPFSVSALNEERSGITKFLQNNGYYKFNKDFIRFIADTVANERNVDVTLILEPYRASRTAEETPHPCYTIRDIQYQCINADTIPLRQSVLDENTIVRKGEKYSATALQNTYRRFGRLQALRFANVHFTEIEDTMPNALAKSGAGLLDCRIQMAANKKHSIAFQPEGTNTAGDFGAAASLAYEDRNLFRGSETFSLQLRGAYESIKGLEGYQNHDYVEYGVEGKLQFPRLLAPLLSHKFITESTSTTEFSVAYNMQNRPEFHRRVFSAALRYKWNNAKRNTQYRLDLLDLSYVHMPWISETFKRDYLDSVSTRNAILRYNYEDLFIMKLGFGVSYSDADDAIKFNIETSGNFLGLFCHTPIFKRNEDNQYTLFNIAYAQYVKGDISATHLFKLSPRSELAVHGALGVAYPYGNSNILPFEKRYFSGGANSLRGWSVRGLGPGSYSGSDGRIDFINQTGDIKLDLNMEYRAFLFWKVYMAAFVDAGNIWTIRNYDAQPGGQFRFDSFYKQLAADYGVGIRFNFGYFILRFDCAMKAVNPAYNTSKEHFPIFSPKMSRDFKFHFAVGLPF